MHSKLALEYGRQLQPHRDLRSLWSALGLVAGGCTTPIPDPPAAGTSPVAAADHVVTTTWYVSPTGSDTSAGTEHAPFKTLAHAVTVSRAVPAGSPRTILLDSGAYHVAATLELIELDSHLTIAALQPDVESAPAVLSGGVPLDLPPAAWSVHAELPAGKVYVATLPLGVPHFDQLFAGQARQIRAKHPNGNPETMQVPISSACDNCGYYAGKAQWINPPRHALPHTVVNVNWTDGAPVIPKPGPDGYILNVISPYCVNCSSIGGERKTYQAVVGGPVASQSHITNQNGPASGFETCFCSQHRRCWGSQRKHVSNPA